MALTGAERQRRYMERETLFKGMLTLHVTALSLRSRECHHLPPVMCKPVTPPSVTDDRDGSGGRDAAAGQRRH